MCYTVLNLDMSSRCEFFVRDMLTVKFVAAPRIAMGLMRQIGTEEGDMGVEKT